VNIWVLALVVHVSGGYATLMAPGYWATQEKCSEAMNMAWARKEDVHAVAAQCIHIKMPGEN
jgi:hypothetical protein